MKKFYLLAILLCSIATFAASPAPTSSPKKVTPTPPPKPIIQVDQVQKAMDIIKSKMYTENNFDAYSRHFSFRTEEDFEMLILEYALSDKWFSEQKKILAPQLPKKYLMVFLLISNLGNKSIKNEPAPENIILINQKFDAIKAINPSKLPFKLSCANYLGGKNTPIYPRQVLVRIYLFETTEAPVQLIVSGWLREEILIDKQLGSLKTSEVKQEDISKVLLINDEELKEYDDMVFISGHLKNISDKEIDHATIRCYFLDENEKPYFDQIAGVSDIQPNYLGEFILSAERKDIPKWTGKYRIEITDATFKEDE